MQCTVDQRVDQKIDQRLAKSHPPGQYLDIALVRGQYLDIALEAGQYKIYCPAKAFDPPTQSVTCISYNMGSSALPDMYARSPRAAGPRAEGIHIRQSTSAHVITNMLHFGTLEICTNLAHPTYILKDAHCDCGILL